MSEPGTVAEKVEQVIPGVWRWFVWDDRIDFESDAHAIADARGTVLIDPLPLKQAALRKLQPVAAICLTAACHQRSAWRFRKQFGARVYAPEGSRAMEEEPDVYYTVNEELPGGLKAIHTPGPEDAHFAFWREKAPNVLFCPDLVMQVEGGELAFVPPAYHDDPDATRDSVRRLLDLPFSVLCMDHGAPIKKDPQAALRKLFDQVMTCPHGSYQSLVQTMLGCCNLPAMDYLAAAIYFQDSERTEWLRILLVKAGLPEQVRSNFRRNVRIGS